MQVVSKDTLVWRAFSGSFLMVLRGLTENCVRMTSVQLKPTTAASVSSQALPQAHFQAVCTQHSFSDSSSCFVDEVQ